ncbi:MAG: NUDIX hydrolase [Methanomicrobiales archaeon 53_19]|uniref:NUDIX hydrolase n=1 Tax=Methanocalculus sp. TaxID=2004547 RepID=UPI0007473F4D|nr:NUDIX hydrolase [Methanocalculus sp.]KUK71131.1 MAG: NUDIX hydrolase [Methanocalculus sp. 52_23]KUL04991.1 MAG: NUDIX hydrolase [Methanomicrobiales archaeon 53_19]HIJ06004.1 NUDIX hydrolase [Methanocalculus sp.]
MTIIYQGRRLSVELRTVDLPNGSTKETIVVHPGGAVAMLPCDGDDCYLIRQFRPAISDYIYEVPAGTMEDGELPEETVSRELIEETRMRSDLLIPRGIIMTTPGFTDEVIHLYEARNLSPATDFDPDEDEVIEVVRLPIKEAVMMARDGRIIDAKTIALLFRCIQERS